MTSEHALGARLELAPGSGWLARRPDALVWAPGAERPAAVLAAFLDAPNPDAARAAVGAAVVDAGFDVAPFTVVTWGAALHVVVMGALDVETDVPSLPSLSGVRSTTWVEHRVATVPAAVVLAGDRPIEGTALEAGVVRSGGFRLTLAPQPEDQAALATVAPAPPAETSDDEPPDDQHGAHVLDLITGGDWMDDSIEITFPGRLAPADESIAPADPAPAEPTPAHARGSVAARRCRNGHANPPDEATCRHCDEFLDAGQPVETVPPPRLGDVVTEEGDVVPIIGHVVVGRRPDVVAGRVDDEAARCVVPGAPGVSRTHVVVSTAGWVMTATDCGSRGGTLLISGAADPVDLVPWVPREVRAGDVLFLGGPTSIRIASVDDGLADRGDRTPSPA